MMPMSKLHGLAGLVALALVAGTPALARAAGDKACEALPRSALKTRTCNPQDDCLARIQKVVQGDARAARQRECSRLPTRGMCYGPDTYDPQADCKDAKKR
jgi:hypothetical protein